VCPNCEAVWGDGYHFNGASGEFRGRVSVVHVPYSEARLLALMLRKPGRVVRYEEFFNELWGLDPNGGPERPEKNINVHKAKLSRLLVEAGAPFSIKSTWGMGYRIEPSQGDAT
jgi:DNA-binding response OmpR family regulator